ncbi:MAG: carbamoyl-phosphate synthase large subunit [Bdellovibrio sp.]|nr:MAG: carbamoyl-phosphate synthase large subunit [Bdellovibrio sp.]
MPKRSDIQKVVILGSGPIVIGQACEFDYSGTQACKALMSHGYEVVLVNSNPATIMTDPDVASKVYIEPLTFDFVKKVLEKERPQGLIPTLGGQTALNLGLELHQKGVLEELQIELLGAQPEVIQAAEDREQFNRILDSVGARYPKSFLVKSFEEGVAASEKLGFPIILRPNYTLGGGGGGIAFSAEEFRLKLATALHESPSSEVLVEESILGWKEFELEIMRDARGTFVVICSIENLDPCGVHTGDSITVAPQQTLSDREYQAMRDEALKVVNAVGVQTGGANIQFAIHPQTGERVVIEMNPRVSRSSALASKATGFPIAKIAALLAVGYHLDELPNDITKKTPCCYEPALDYVVTKIPRFAFEKFPGSKDSLNTQMKSVGEVMGIGRTFKESLQKAILSLEQDPRGCVVPQLFKEELLSYPNSQRIFQIFEAFRQGKSIEQVYRWTQITPWFLMQIQSLVHFENEIRQTPLSKDFLWEIKRQGFSDAAIAFLKDQKEESVQKLRKQHQVLPAFYQVDTCAGEFSSETPYYYSTYWGTHWPREKLSKRSVVILGSGPNRIGQGIEFDYSCVRSVKAFQEENVHVIMVNSNPETVSTDYDTADELFFDPLTAEHVGEILDYVHADAFVSQLGGQTPINLAPHLVHRGHSMLGSDLKAMDLAEDRGQFAKICREFAKVPLSGMAANLEEALELVREMGYPVICRPSYVLGGRRMEIVENEEELRQYFEKHGVHSPCLVDQFLERALEVDVDLVRGKDWTLLGGILEHIEAAGVHSGDSMGVVPPQRLKKEMWTTIENLSVQIAEKLNVIGFLNLQLAIKNDEVYVLEANPRSSRSVPFLSKATGVPLVKMGVQALLGKTKEQVQPLFKDWKDVSEVCVKGVVFPFKKFPNADSILGPEMKSTGESMGRGKDYAQALLKAFVASHVSLPQEGEVFLSLRDKDKEELLPVAQELQEMGFHLSATRGTAEFLQQHGVECEMVKKVHEGRPHCVDRIRSGKVSFVINTTSGRQSIEASLGIRRSCIDYSIPCITESDAAKAFILALRRKTSGELEVNPL